MTIKHPVHDLGEHGVLLSVGSRGCPIGELVGNMKGLLEHFKVSPPAALVHLDLAECVTDPARPCTDVEWHLANAWLHTLLPAQEQGQ